MTLREWVPELLENETFLLEFADLLDCEVWASGGLDDNYNFPPRAYDTEHECPTASVLCSLNQFGLFGGPMWVRICVSD